MAKKDFTARDNPVMKYISSVEPVATPAPMVEPAPAPVVKKPKPVAREAEGSERKSKRLNLLIQPSVLEDLAKVAAMRRTSVNDLINTLARACVEENRALIGQYDDVFGQGE